MLSEARYDWVERSRKDPVFKAKFEAEIGRRMEEIALRRIPQLRGKTPAFRLAGTPVGCNPWAWESCSLGLEPSADRFVKLTHALRPRTKVKNLFLTGQDSFSMGFAGSMVSARLTYAAMFGNSPDFSIPAKRS